MTSPFDALAPSYNTAWTDTPRGREQRAAVWKEIDGLFRAGDRVLDLGCGTGDDALHLMSQGIEVVGIDASPQMVEVARGRGVQAHVGQAIGWCGLSPAEQTPAAKTDRLRHAFSGAISNFGVLNCVRDLHSVSVQLAKLIHPGGPLAICLMGRFCLTDWRHAMNRWIGHAQWRGMDVYYPTARRVRAAFAPAFKFERRVSIGGGDHQLYIFRRRVEC
jgi:ubiquinone/menaquinone biosynthesis C-methylase UbiE